MWINKDFPRRSREEVTIISPTLQVKRGGCPAGIWTETPGFSQHLTSLGPPEISIFVNIYNKHAYLHIPGASDSGKHMVGTPYSVTEEIEGKGKGSSEVLGPCLWGADIK